MGYVIEILVNDKTYYINHEEKIKLVSNLKLASIYNNIESAVCDFYSNFKQISEMSLSDIQMAIREVEIQLTDVKIEFPSIF